MLNTLMQRGSAFLGTEYPIMCGAMTWVSDPNLVAAVSKEGCFASLAGGNTPPEILENQIAETKKMTSAHFALNLITTAPAFQSHLEILKTQNVPFVIFAGGLPKDKEIAAAKESGAKVICFASTNAVAERMISFGADALLIEGCESGGHIGQVSTMVLIQEILFNFSEKVPVFVAGGIATGNMMAHLLLMGASGIQMGTRFVMTQECLAHENFKKKFLASSARDAQPTPQFSRKMPVAAVRALRNQGTDDFNSLQLQLLKKVEENTLSPKDAAIELERFWVGSLRKAAVEGDVDLGSVMAGQSVGLVNDILPMKQLVKNLLDDAEAELVAIAQKLNK